MLKTDYDASVSGNVASVTVTQRFSNPGEVPIHATYAFPLHERAAVYAMTMRTGERTVRAKVMKDEEAKETFEAAKEQGKHAALLDQHRPNLFTQQVANIAPGEEVVVKLEYTQTVPKRDGRYRLTLPLVVGPRYDDGPRSDQPRDGLRAGLLRVDGGQTDGRLEGLHAQGAAAAAADRQLPDHPFPQHGHRVFDRAPAGHAVAHSGGDRAHRTAAGTRGHQDDRRRPPGPQRALECE